MASVVRKMIAPVLMECPVECGIVSITEIEVSGDFSYVDVYISALDHPEQALAFLEAKRKELRGMLGSLGKRRVPELRFKIDPRTEQGERIDALLV